MAGEKCTRKFWKEVKKWSGNTGTICKSGGKKRATRHPARSRDMGVNRDRTIVSDTGRFVRRMVWTTAIAEYDRATDTLVLRDGGYHTRLTKGRLNQVLKKLGLTIRQKDYVWYINDEKWRSPYTIRNVTQHI